MKQEAGSTEVHALQYWATITMFVLDNMFLREVKGWNPNTKGFKVTYRYFSSDDSYALTIQPAGWPKNSDVSLSLKSGGMGGSHSPESGRISAQHLNFGLSFKCEFFTPQPHIQPADKNTSPANLLEDILSRRGIPLR